MWVFHPSMQDDQTAPSKSPADERGFFSNRRGDLIAVLALSIILAVGAGLRWFGLAWDSGYLFHPDERQILLVASNLAWPRSIVESFSSSSPLNPHFFAYGTFPIYLLRLLAPLAPPAAITGPWANDFLARWVVFGRAISGLFDLGTIAIVYVIGRRLYSIGVALTAAASVAVTVLHIQLSHFYAVDTLLTFFVLATLYASLRLGARPSPFWQATCGLAFGLAMATKLSAVPLLAPIAYACYHVYAPRAGRGLPLWPRATLIWHRIRRPLLQICLLAFGVFLLTQPYVLLDWYTFGRDVIREGWVARGWLDVPYTRQFAHAIPYFYQVWQSGVWGMGLPLGFWTWGGALLFIAQYCLKWRSSDAHATDPWRDSLLLSWAVLYFATIGGQYVKYPRYLLPLLPVLGLMAARALFSLRFPRPLIGATVPLVLCASFFYALAVESIYGREHPWLTASRWIYDNLKPGSAIAVEPWDDTLPVLIDYGSFQRRGSDYDSIALPVYDADTPSKMAEIARILSRADYVILSSQRAYGSIGRMPERYPLTINYYQKLFDGELGYTLAETVRNDAGLGNMKLRNDSQVGLGFAASIPLGVDPGMQWNWGYADESFTVYDHPQPLIFEKTRVLTLEQLNRELNGPLRQ